MRIKFEANDVRAEAQSLFDLARRVLSGANEAPPPPVDPIDVQSGIGRALRLTRRGPDAVESQAQIAARAIAIVEGTLVAIDAIDGCLSEAQDMVNHALAAHLPQARALFAGRYADVIARVDTVAAGATFDGVNLINLGRDKIELISPFGAKPRHEIGHIVLTAGERGLNLKAPKQDFHDDAEIEAAAATLTRARARLIKAADTFVAQALCMAPYLKTAAAA